MLSSIAWIAERVPLGGPVATTLMALSVLGASGTTTRGMVDAVAGERGSTLAGPRSASGRAAHERTLPPRGTKPKAGPTSKKDTEEDTGGGSAATSAIAGFADDALVPLLRFTPGPVKAVGAGVGAAAMFGALLYDASRYDTPPKKHH